MILVDTDVLIWHLCGQPRARDRLRSARQLDPLTVSAVTVAEPTGACARQRAARSGRSSRRWSLGRSRTPWHAEQGELIRAHRRSRAIGIGDYLIAAAALERRHEPATPNIEHYPMFTGLTTPFELDGTASTAE